MKKLFVISLVYVHYSMAQLNFYQGYIINESGDTLKGEIKANPKKELSLYAKVMFRDMQGMTKTYKPDKIKGFGYYNIEKKKWHYFISNQQKEPQFYRIAVQYPVIIYEYQYEDMQMGEFFTAREYYILHNNEYIKLKSKKFKKQLSEYIDNPDVLSEIDKMEELDIDKLSSLLEKHYTSKTSS